MASFEVVVRYLTVVAAVVAAWTAWAGVTVVKMMGQLSAEQLWQQRFAGRLLAALLLPQVSICGGLYVRGLGDGVLQIKTLLWRRGVGAAPDTLRLDGHRGMLVFSLRIFGDPLNVLTTLSAAMA